MSSEQRSITQVPFVSNRGPVIGARLASLRPGTPVTLVQDGKHLDVTVQSFRKDGSLDHAQLSVGYGPGRWNREVSGAAIAGGYVDLLVAA